MGLYDESWCADCGKSQPYSKDDVICGECAMESADIRSSQLINYMKFHLISLEQDLEELSEKIEQVDENSKSFKSMDEEYLYLSGQIKGTGYLLSVASDILGIPTEEK